MSGGASKLSQRKLPGLERLSPGPNMELRRIKAAYMERYGLEPREQARYARVNEDRARRLADWQDTAPHSPDDPETIGAYRAFIRENNAQLQTLLDAGYEFEEGVYEKPRESIDSLLLNRSLKYFPTSLGWGSEREGAKDFSAGNLLFEDSPFLIKGKRLNNTEVFRIVHDAFGHAPEGAMFGPRGEENAWIHHMQMYSEKAQPALTAETRAQNAWVNFGPFADHNRGATDADTIYPNQPMSLAPDWAMEMDEESFRQPISPSAARRALPPLPQVSDVPGETQEFFADASFGIRGRQGRVAGCALRLNARQEALYEAMRRFQRGRLAEEFRSSGVRPRLQRRRAPHLASIRQRASCGECRVAGRARRRRDAVDGTAQLLQAAVSIRR